MGRARKGDMKRENHIIHVGTHKTGSTWLQRHVFPTVREATFGNSEVFRALLRSLIIDRRSHEKALQAAVYEVGGRVLLSNETLAAGRPWRGWQRVSADCIADRLSRAIPEARIILFTRERQSLVRSLYSQYVRQGGHLPWRAFEERVLLDEYLDLRSAIERYRSRFQHVIVLDYERLRDDPEGCVSQIGAFCEVEFEYPSHTPSVNVSLSWWQLHALRAWNRFFRASRHNPKPPFPLPHADVMTRILQKS